MGRAGAYGALALLMLALEVILLFWFARASSEGERITAGSLMVVVFLAVIGVVAWVEYLKRPATSPEVRQVGELIDKPAVPPQEIERGVQADEAGKQAPGEPISAPDGSYMIARPPVGWTVRVTTQQEILAEVLGASTVSELDQLGKMRVLVMQFGAPIVWTPLPGKTRINGRLFPLLLTEPLGRKLQIISMRRRQPPLYSERSLYDTVITQLSIVLQTGIVSVVSITPGTLPKTSREMIVVDATQEFENILLAGKVVDVLHLNIGFMAVRGDLYDYLLIATNLRVGQGVDPAAKQMDADVKNVLDSFRLLSSADPREDERSDRMLADQDFEQLISSNGPKWFENQFGLALARLKDIDLNSATGLEKAASLLKPFRSYAQTLRGEDSDLRDLWTALDGVELGNTKPLRDILSVVLFGFSLGQLKEIDIYSESGIYKAVSVLKPFRNYADALKGQFADDLWAALDHAETGDIQRLRELLHRLVEPEATLTPPTAVLPPPSSTSDESSASV